MRVLGLDTAFASVGVALWQGEPGEAGHVLVARATPMDRGHGEALMPIVAEVMAEAGFGFDALDRIAVTRGPGAFTGIRIGLAAARGLALGAGVPCIGVSTFAAVAANVAEDERAGRPLLVAFDTKRGDFYAALVQGADADVPSGQVVGLDGLADFVAGHGRVLVVGDGAAPAVEHLSRAGVDASQSAAAPLPDAVRVAELAARLDATAHPPAPVYLRPPAVTLPGVGPVG